MNILHDQANVAEPLERLSLLRVRVESMNPLQCFYLHEQRIKEEILLTHGDVQDVLCSAETRRNNPACAHCFAHGGGAEMESAFPWLRNEMRMHLKVVQSAERSPNPFAIELIKAIEEGVFENEIDYTTVKQDILDAFETMKVQLLSATPGDTEDIHAFCEDIERSLAKIFGERARYGEARNRLLEHTALIKNIIDEQDRYADMTAQAGTYYANRAQIGIQQQFVITQLLIVKKFLLEAIDRKMAEIR